MMRFAIRCALVGALFCLPLVVLAQAAQGDPAEQGEHAEQGAQDPMDGVLQQLGLTPDQKAKTDKLIAAYKEKQKAVPPPGDVLVKDREAARQLVTATPFDKVKAEALTKQAAVSFQQRLLNRMELRNQICQLLTPQQKEQFVKKMMGAMSKGR